MKVLIAFVALGMMASMASGVAAETFTVATFMDPSGSSSDPLFTVDWVDETVNGGWADGKGGLTLQFGAPFGGAVFTNAWFSITELSIDDTATVFGKTFGQTGAGQVDFYAAGTATDPLLSIAFEEALVSMAGVAGDESSNLGIWAQDVVFSGSQIGTPLWNQQFSFSFANIVALPGGTVDQTGFTATAAFTSSAVPEPSTLVLLAIGALAMLGRRRPRS